MDLAAAIPATAKLGQEDQWSTSPGQTGGSYFKTNAKTCVLAHENIPSPWELEAGRSGVQGQPGYVRLCCGLNKNVPHICVCLDTRSPVSAV